MKSYHITNQDKAAIDSVVANLFSFKIWNMNQEYEQFLMAKSQLGGNHGFEPLFMPDFLFDFQKYLIQWSLMKGRSAMFADTGLGKTPMQLVWAENIVRHTNKNVLILTPLAVAYQTCKEGEKFGIDVQRSRDGKPHGKITVTNYQQIEKFDPGDFIGCVCDESSALKNFEGATKTNVTRFMNKLPYRLLCTATPSPNDFVELGTSSEALGELKYMDMLAQFFRDTSNDKNPQWSTPHYILKGHAAENFWKWVSSWARACRKPSDLGFSDETHRLPELVQNEIVLQCTMPLPGELFVRKAVTLKDQRIERKLTLDARVQKVKELCEPHDLSVIWGHFNYECDYMEKQIPDAVQISGSDSDESKEEKFIAFANSQIKRLIIKPMIGAWGLNWQHCNHTTFFPSHSYEQLYQGIRRFYRFGQQRKVYVDLITTEGEMGVYQNIKRKSIDADRMFEMLVKHMHQERKIENKTHFNNEIKLPEWLQN